MVLTASIEKRDASRAVQEKPTTEDSQPAVVGGTLTKDLSVLVVDGGSNPSVSMWETREEN